MELVWDHTFREQLGIDPRECLVLLTEPPLNPTRNRERMLEVMFETFGFHGAFVQIQAVLTLYAQGLLSGLVLDSGDGVTHAVRPWHHGMACPGARLRRAGSISSKHVCHGRGHACTCATIALPPLGHLG